MKQKDVYYETLMDSLLKDYFKSNKKRFVVLIGGCSRSGKTTLANKIKVDCDKKNIKCIIISLDNWLLGLDERKGDETVKERFKYEDIVEAITQIIDGGTVYTSIYDPKTRMIVCEKSPEPIYIDEGICIIDGVIALDNKQLRKISDFKIFVDVKDAKRVKRLVEFYSNYKKCSLDKTRKIITSREEEEVPIIKKTKQYADLIYKSGESKIDEIDNSVELIIKIGV